MRTQQNHTPGPWRVWRDMDPKEPLQVVGPSDDFTAVVAMENTNALANAALIAESPNMLKALQAIVAILDGRQPIDVPGAVMVANSAIAKAQGGAQ